MVKSLSAACLLLLTGCVTSAHLVGDNGERYPLNIERSTSSLSTNIGGTEYRGKYVRSESTGAAFGARGATVVATSGNSGQAILLAANGDFIDCGFTASGSTVLGRCESKNGKRYILTSE